MDISAFVQGVLDMNYKLFVHLPLDLTNIAVEWV